MPGTRSKASYGYRTYRNSGRSGACGLGELVHDLGRAGDLTAGPATRSNELDVCCRSFHIVYHRDLSVLLCCKRCRLGTFRTYPLASTYYFCSHSSHLSCSSGSMPQDTASATVQAALMGEPVVGCPLGSLSHGGGSSQCFSDVPRCGTAHRCWGTYLHWSMAAAGVQRDYMLPTLAVLVLGLVFGTRARIRIQRLYDKFVGAEAKASWKLATLYFFAALVTIAVLVLFIW